MPGCQVSSRMTIMSRYVESHFLIAFGFLAGKEVQEAGVGNLGLQDRAYFSHIDYSNSREIDHVIRSRTSGSTLGPEIYISIQRRPL
jgi:hypothetical protein